MVSKKINHKKSEKSKYSIFYEKSKSFYKGMKMAYEVQNWDSVGLHAVHCVISANDALLSSECEICCSSKDHMAAIDLLTGNIKLNGVMEASKHLRRVIALKNTIAYEAKLITQKQATTLYNHTIKFFAWITLSLNIKED